jgi:hypothetical protein
MRGVVLGLVFAISVIAASAAEMSVPKQVTAGNAITISMSGSGEGQLILVGPASVVKQKVKLGGDATISATDLQTAGRYLAVLKASDGNSSAEFYVEPANVASVVLLAQPSRVPAARPDVVSGTAFVMDKYNNLVMTPTPVRFELGVPGTPPVTRIATSKDGVAWVRMDSSKRAGNAQMIASVGDSSVKRIVQEVAADPCNLRMTAQRDKNGILVQTDPVRDCSGNPVPDGTIVTFTQVDPSGKSTVDARIKQGIAKAELPAASKATISVASGVVVGNEIRWGGGL